MPEMDVALKDAMQIDGAIGVALVDYTSGMALGLARGNKDLDLSVAAAGNTDVVRASCGRCRAGLVTFRKEGSAVYYSITSPPVAELLADLRTTSTR